MPQLGLPALLSPIANHRGTASQHQRHPTRKAPPNGAAAGITHTHDGRADSCGFSPMMDSGDTKHIIGSSVVVVTGQTSLLHRALV
jgi:hypothetical protein